MPKARCPMVRAGVGVGLAAALSALGEARASFVLRSPTENETVVLIEETRPFSRYVGVQPSELESPGRYDLPVVFLDEDRMGDLCTAFQSDGSVGNYSGHMLLFDHGSDFMCGGSIGNQANYLYMEKWCELNATLLMISNSNEFFIVHPGDYFRGILAGPAGEAVKNCFWAHGKLSRESEATEILRLASQHPGVYTGDLELDWARHPRPVIVLVWEGLIGVAFLLLAMLGIFVFKDRYQHSYQMHVEHVVILAFNIGSCIVLGVVRLASVTIVLGMNVLLATFQDFFTLSAAASCVLMSLYVDAADRLEPSKKSNPFRRRLALAAAGVLCILEFVGDFAILDTHTGGQNLLIAGIALLLIIVQTIVIVRLWIRTKHTADLLRQAQSTPATGDAQFFRIVEHHLRYWTRISVLAAVGSLVTLALVATGLMASQYSLLRGVFDSSKCLSSLAQINACRSLRQTGQQKAYASRKHTTRLFKRSETSQKVYPRSSVNSDGSQVLDAGIKSDIIESQTPS